MDYNGSNDIVNVQMVAMCNRWFQPVVSVFVRHLVGFLRRSIGFLLEMLVSLQETLVFLQEILVFLREFA